jgi:hypothetical protein
MDRRRTVMDADELNAQSIALASSAVADISTRIANAMDTRAALALKRDELILEKQALTALKAAGVTDEAAFLERFNIAVEVSRELHHAVTANIGLLDYLTRELAAAEATLLAARTGIPTTMTGAAS